MDDGASAKYIQAVTIAARVHPACWRVRYLYLFGHNYFTVYGKMVVPLCSEIFSGQTHTPIDWKFHCASFAV